MDKKLSSHPDSKLVFDTSPAKTDRSINYHDLDEDLKQITETDSEEEVKDNIDDK